MAYDEDFDAGDFDAELDDARPRSDLTLEGARASSAGRLYRNLETAPGQVYLTPPAMSANEELALSRDQAVRQARHVERTSEHVRGGLNKKADLTVGGALRVSAIPDWIQLGFKDRKAGIAWVREWSRLAESLFHSWAYDARLLADSEGNYTFGGLMWMAFRNRSGPDGECAGVIHYDQDRADEYGTPWATHITVIDPQRIETPPEQILNQLGVEMPRVIDGRLIDSHRRMIGFWVREDPDRTPGVLTKHIFVPREIKGGRPMGFHWFVKTRGAAQRGITDMVNMLRRNTMLDQFDTSILGAAAVAAAMATYIKTSRPKKDVAEDLNVAPSSAGADGAVLIDLTQMVADKSDFYKKLNLRTGGNRVPMLDLDDELIIAAANSATEDPTAFRNNFLREFASALGIDFEQFSGYYGDVNYSSARLALMNIMRGVMRERSMFFPAVPSIIYSAVIEEAIVKGWLPLSPNATGGVEHFYRFREAYTRCKWTAPALGWVDPQKEATAAQIRTDPAAPISTLGDEAAAQGKTIEELIEERADEQQMLLDAGLINDLSDRAAAKGAQAAPVSEPDSGNPPAPPKKKGK